MRFWVKVDTNLDTHPKARRAGFWGLTVAQVLWRLAKRHGCDDGNVTTFWDADYLGEVLRLQESEVELLAQGMVSAVNAGLVELVDGQVYIHEWQSTQQDLRREWSERKRRERARKRDTGKSDDASVTVTDVTRDSVTVSECPADQIRLDQIRRDQIQDPPADKSRNASPKSQDPVATDHPVRLGQASVVASSEGDCTRGHAVALLQHYRTELMRLHQATAPVDYAGKELDHALAVLRGRTLERAKVLVTRYCQLDGKVAEEGWPFAWIRQRVVKLEAMDRVEALQSTDDVVAECKRLGIEVVS